MFSPSDKHIIQTQVFQGQPQWQPRATHQHTRTVHTMTASFDTVALALGDRPDPTDCDLGTCLKGG
jgi:hypothetical protein